MSCSSTERPPVSRLAAMGLALAAFLLFSINDAVIKHLMATYPLPQMVFFNGMFALIPVLLLASRQGGWRLALHTRRPVVQVLRGLVGVSIALSAFFAFSRMAMADVYAILFASPLLIAALSAVFFNEKLDRRGWAAVLVGFGGVLTMLHPQGQGFNEGALAALWGSLAFAASALIVRHWGRQEQPASFPFYGCLMCMAVMGGALPFVFVPPTLADLALMAVCGVIGGSGLCCMLNAFRLAPPPVVAPFQYTQMLWGVLFGVAFFGDKPDVDLIFGAGAVIASGLYLLLRERRR